MDNLRELLSQLKLFLRFDMAVVDKLETHDERIYKLEENRKTKDQAILSLERRYSELLLILKELKQHDRI